MMPRDSQNPRESTLVSCHERCIQVSLAGRETESSKIEAEENENSRKIVDSAELDSDEENGLLNSGHDMSEDMIMRKLSRVPYPSLYKARLLCWSWYSKFSILRTWTSFQNKITASAVKWPKYAPVAVLGKDIVGYNRSQNCWHKLRLNSRVPVDLYVSPFSSSWRQAFAGCLMCAVRRVEDGSLRVLVANTLTGDWKLLPSPPEIKGQPILDFRFVREGSRDYKILVHNLPCPQFQAHVYESKETSRTWTRMSSSDSGAAVSGIPGLSPFSTYTDGYINGSLYVMIRDSRSMGQMVIWKFVTETRVWEEFLLPQISKDNEFPAGMYHCGAKFMVVTLHEENFLLPAGVDAASHQHSLGASVYELDLQAMTLMKISKSPPGMAVGTRQTVSLVSDSECTIYFCDIPNQGPPSFSSFNVNEHSWSYLPLPFLDYKWQWGRFSTFEPGLNPFASP